MSESARIRACKKALEYIDDDMIIGIGTGNTVNFFIQELVSVKNKIDACVASSKKSEELLKNLGFTVIPLNTATQIPIYIDSADEVNMRGEMIKGGGGALTGEKIVASVANKFICIVNEEKIVKQLGNFPVAVEVIPMARSLVGREIVKLGGNPDYREGFITDNGNIIIDVHNLDLTNPMELEKKLKLIPGVVESGVFAEQKANIILCGTDNDIKVINV